MRLAQTSDTIRTLKQGPVQTIGYGKKYEGKRREDAEESISNSAEH